MYVIKKLAAAALVSVTILSGCATTVPLNYSPSSAMTATGSVAVESFTYVPATSGAVDPNEIRSMQLGTPKFDQNIDTLIRDAIFKEFRMVGIRTDDQQTKLTGEIQEFRKDGFGYSVDWTLRIRYIVTGPNGVKYEAVKETKRTLANILASVNELIKLNIEGLLSDPSFMQAIDGSSDYTIKFESLSYGKGIAAKYCRAVDFPTLFGLT